MLHTEQWKPLDFSDPIFKFGRNRFDVHTYKLKRREKKEKEGEREREGGSGWGHFSFFLSLFVESRGV
jgi:hypothetical protein